MKHSKILFPVFLALALAACKDDTMEVREPQLEVSLEKEIYAPGEDVSFRITGGDADFISFYSGEAFHQYDYRTGRSVEFNGLKMSFYSRVKLGAQANQLSVFISSDFNGDYSDYASVQAATWTDITSLFRMSSGDVVASGTVDIMDYIDEDANNYIGFRYTMRPTAQYGKRRTWQISESKVFTTNDLYGEVPLVDGPTAFRLVDQSAGTDHACSSSITEALIELQGPLNDATLETVHWAISSPFTVSSEVEMGPDRPAPVKSYSDAPMSEYRYVYNTPGIYTVTFVAYNSTLTESKSVMKQMKVKIRRPAPETEE